MADPLLLAVETGGTKIVCRCFARDGRVAAQFRLPTTTPQACLDGIAAGLPEGVVIEAVGVASFGPVDLDPASLTFGAILTSTKTGWSGFNLARALEDRFGASVAIDTDVNAAALAEQALGAGQGLATVAYVTVGTGIGAGLAIEGRTLIGGLHPEIGHLRLRRAPGDAQASACPFHEDCAEGLAAGPAIQQRLAGRTLAEAPEVEALLVDYLGRLCAAIVLVWSPHRIVLGGGVIAHDSLPDRIRRALLGELNGYGVGRRATEPGYVVRSALEHAGLEGAALMALRQGQAGVGPGNTGETRPRFQFQA